MLAMASSYKGVFYGLVPDGSRETTVLHNSQVEVDIKPNLISKNKIGITRIYFGETETCGNVSVWV